MELMYSEKEKAEQILKNGFINREYRYQQALWVAKYFRHILGYGDARIKTELIRFCEKNADFFHKDAKGIRGSIKRVIKNSKSKMRDTTESIAITKKEMKSIQSIKNFKWQKILIAMVFIAKINKRTNVWLSEWRKIRLILGRWATNNRIRDAVHDSYLNGLIGETKGDFHDLIFIENNGEKEIEIISEKEIRNVNKIYEKYCGGELIYCKECGKSEIREGSTHAYCSNCSKKVRKEKVKNNVSRYRNIRNHSSYQK